MCFHFQPLFFYNIPSRCLEMLFFRCCSGGVVTRLLTACRSEPDGSARRVGKPAVTGGSKCAKWVDVRWTLRVYMDTLLEAHPCLFLFPTLCSKGACLQFPTLGCLRLVVTLENILSLTRMSGTCRL